MKGSQRHQKHFSCFPHRHLLQKFQLKHLFSHSAGFLLSLVELFHFGRRSAPNSARLKGTRSQKNADD
jgi:hypothetical protein